MTVSNGKQNGTLYEQVLEFARREIEDASSKIEELRRSLHLLESRVEAAKSVYEAVAARLNLEDELEDEARFDLPAYAETLQPAPEPPEDRVSPPAAEAPARPVSPPSASASRPQQPHAVPPKPASFRPAGPEGSANGTPDGFTMDLIRRHLEAREQAAKATVPTPSANKSPASAPPVQTAPDTASSDSSEAPEQPASQEGFPGLSEADRALIGEYLRSKREG